MCDFFLSYLFLESGEETADELLRYINWTDEEKKMYNYPKTLNIKEEDLKLFTKSKNANEILSKLYFEDNDLLFLIVYTQRLLYYSSLNHLFIYNENWDDNNDYNFITDIEVFILKTKNKIFIFGKPNDEYFRYYDFEEIVLKSNEENINSKIAQDTFSRLNIEKNLNYKTLEKIVEDFYKSEIRAIIC